MIASIEKMTDAIASIMNEKVYGIWLYGSIVLDDYRPGWRDIDFIALTESIISEKQAEQLLMLRQNMLEKEPDNRYYRSFEGIVANITEFRNNAFKRLVYWGTSGQRVTDSYFKDPISGFELAKYARNVYGNASWILPVPDEKELINAVRSHYDSIRKYAVHTDEKIYSCGWLLDIARCIYTLRYKDVIAKTKAGEWVLAEHIFSDEEPLKKTLKIRRNPLFYVNNEDLKPWFKSLGPVIQRYADVLEGELQELSDKGTVLLSHLSSRERKYE